jgi:hypothetical protein
MNISASGVYISFTPPTSEVADWWYVRNGYTISYMESCALSKSYIMNLCLLLGSYVNSPFFNTLELVICEQRLVTSCTWEGFLVLKGSVWRTHISSGPPRFQYMNLLLLPVCFLLTSHKCGDFEPTQGCKMSLGPFVGNFPCS